MSQWDGKSKGSLIGYKIFLFLIRISGVVPAYVLLRFISFYYLLFAGKQRSAIQSFYQQTLGVSRFRAFRLASTNFFMMGQTLVDRAAFLVGVGKSFTYTFKNEEHLLEITKQGRGGVLISGHVGNWETAGNLLNKRITPQINVLMLDAEVQKIKDFMQKSTGGSKFNIIPIKNDLSHVVKIHAALANNELIAMHADRTMPGMKYLVLDFMGRKARFPYGPFVIASKFDAPITFVFSVKGKTFHYDLSATLPITAKLQPEEIAALYVKELEKQFIRHPEQWFNYFDFFPDENNQRKH